MIVTLVKYLVWARHVYIQERGVITLVEIVYVQTNRVVYLQVMGILLQVLQVLKVKKVLPVLKVVQVLKDKLVMKVLSVLKVLKVLKVL